MEILNPKSKVDTIPQCFARVNNSSDELWYSPPSIIRVCGGKNQNESVPFMNIDYFKNIDDERIANTRTI